MCASRSGPALLSVPQEQASSPEFGLANMVFLFRDLRIPNPRISPAELLSPCADAASPQANCQEASIDEKPAFSLRPGYRRRRLAALPSAALPSRCLAISNRGSHSPAVPNTSPQCTSFEKALERVQAASEILQRKVPSVPVAFSNCP